MTMSAALDVTRRHIDWGRKKKGRPQSPGLLHLARRNDVIDMQERRHGYFPKVFAWRGRRYDVYAVERCWTIARRGLRGEIERHCFRVRARLRSAGRRSDETFEIYQDLKKKTWHMGRRVA